MNQDKMSKDVRETISIKINPDVWKQAKIQAIEEDITVSKLVEKALREKLNGVKFRR